MNPNYAYHNPYSLYINIGVALKERGDCLGIYAHVYVRAYITTYKIKEVTYK